MNIDKLRAELTEYYLRIEEVLSGMDRLLVDLQNRVTCIEQQLGSGHVIHPRLHKEDR